MKSFYWRAVCVAGLIMGCVQVKAQGSYVLTNENTSAVHTFTNNLGTAQVVDGMIVFEGQLESDIAVPWGASEGTGYLLASMRLLAQIKLFDELPASNEVGNVQGAVAAFRDAPESSTGKYYAWAVTNSAPVAWVPLYQTNGVTPFAVTDGATNYITFVFNYSGTTNSPVGPVTYQISIGDTVDAQIASESQISASAETAGINGVSLLGVGGLETVASATGDPLPLSSSIGFSVYATSSGVLLILDPKHEQGTGWFMVFAKINGKWVEVGKVQSTGAGHYEFLAYPGLLQVGQYEFKVIDELGNPHALAGAIDIKTIKMDSVTMEPGVMVVTFNSEDGKEYQVLSADSLTAETWTVTTIYYPVAGGFAYGSDPFTASGTSTTIKVPRNVGKKFFKIRKTN